MTYLGDCKLCLSTRVEIRDSHIIPEYFYKHIYTTKHTFIPINKNGDSELAIKQKGYRERLLCQSCETKLSIWENGLSQLMLELIQNTSNKIAITKIGKCLFIDRIDYSNIKKAILSIFWRMSISNNSFFSGYSLGKYNEDFRKILHNDNPISFLDFPVLMSKGLLNGIFHEGILYPITKGKYGNKLTMQSVVLNGFVFDIIVAAKKPIPKEIQLFALQPNGNGGQVLIVERPFDELSLDVNSFSNRMRQPDIAAFFNKHN